MTVPAMNRADAAALGEGRDERVAGARADAGQEHDQPDLAQGQVGAVGQGPDQGTGALERAQDQRHQQWTAGKPQCEHQAAGQRNRDQPNQQSRPMPRLKVRTSISLKAR